GHDAAHRPHLLAAQTLPLPSSTLFPYTTLFRSSENRYNGGWDRINNANQVTLGLTSRWFDQDTGFQRLALQVAQRIYFDSQRVRSEEHTSELQSRENLVCRLLLEQKKAAGCNST